MGFIYIRNIQEDYFFHIVLPRESFGDLCPMAFLHDNTQVCPGNLVQCNRLGVVEPSAFSMVAFFEQLFGCLAPILFLVADKEDFHCDDNEAEKLLSLSLEEDDKGGEM